MFNDSDGKLNLIILGYITQHLLSANAINIKELLDYIKLNPIEEVKFPLIYPVGFIKGAKSTEVLNKLKENKHYYIEFNLLKHAIKKQQIENDEDVFLLCKIMCQKAISKIYKMQKQKHIILIISSFVLPILFLLINFWMESDIIKVLNNYSISIPQFILWTAFILIVIIEILNPFIKCPLCGHTRINSSRLFIPSMHFIFQRSRPEMEYVCSSFGMNLEYEFNDDYDLFFIKNPKLLFRNRINKG